jgi:hypothetical protein
MSRIQGAHGGLILGGDARDELTIISCLDHGAATRAGVWHRFCRSDIIKGSCAVPKFFADQRVARPLAMCGEQVSTAGQVPRPKYCRTMQSRRRHHCRAGARCRRRRGKKVSWLP